MKDFSPPKFLLDENVDVRLGDFLKKQGFSVIPCPKGIKNGDVANLAQKQNSILVTNDKDFANPDIFKPAEYEGIIIFRIHPPSLRNLTSAFKLLSEKTDINNLKGKMLVVSKQGIEVLTK